MSAAIHSVVALSFFLLFFSVAAPRLLLAFRSLSSPSFPPPCSLAPRMGLFQPLSESELDALAGLVRFMLSSWFVLWLYFFMQHAKERYGTKSVIGASAGVAVVLAGIVHAWRAGWMHEQFETGSEWMRGCWSSLLESIASGDWVRPIPLLCLGLLIFLLVLMFMAGASYSSSHRGSRSRWIPLLCLFVTIVCVVLALVIIVPKARALYSKCGCDSWLPNLERRINPDLDRWCTQLFCSLAV